MVARLIVPKEGLVNEPLTVMFEIKNVSNRVRYVVDPAKVITDERFLNNPCAVMSIKDGKGADLPLGTRGGYSIVPTDFKPIAPGEVKRATINMQKNLSFSITGKDGQYDIKLAFISPKPQRAVVSNIGRVVGNTMVAEPVYGDPTKDQVDNAWVNTIQTEAAITIRDLPPKLTVHEWGVFCSFADARYANANLRQEWASMPPGFYHQFPDRNLRKVRSGTTRDALKNRSSTFTRTDRIWAWT